MAEDPKLVKVELRGDDGEVETLWAFDLGQGQYKLDNTPWYAYGVSTGDVIETEREDRPGFPVFKRAIDVPPAVDLNAIADFLTKSKIRWEHADPTWEELYGTDG